jgi:release factor glutamine methyltransferase
VLTVDALVQNEADRIASSLGISAGEARRDTQVLLCRALKVSRGWLAAHAHDRADPTVAAQLRTLCDRRAQGEPVAYITGTREFYGLEFAVNPAVLIPRPETEILVDLALSVLPQHASHRVLDLGTGSGAIAIALAHARPQIQVVATDISPKALAVAQDNAQRHVVNRVEFVQSDWYTALNGERFDLIVSNPPYVARSDAHLESLRFEPSLALVGGQDGLASLRKIIADAPAHLTRGGHLLLEHGLDQAEACAGMLGGAGFAAIESHIDLAGIPRIACGRLTLSHAPLTA